MKQFDPLDALLREWMVDEPNERLDQRVIAAYRSTKHSEREASRVWRQFWTTRVSIPAPVLVVAFAVFVLVLLLRPSPPPALSPQGPGVVTRLNVTGFQPLPRGDARVVAAMEVQR